MADADFNALQQSVGPKRVKTKEVEIEAHDPMKLQALQERRGVKAVTFGQFSGTYAVPKDPCPLERRRNYYDYYDYPYDE